MNTAQNVIITLLVKSVTMIMLFFSFCAYLPENVARGEDSYTNENSVDNAGTEQSNDEGLLEYIKKHRNECFVSVLVAILPMFFQSCRRILIVLLMIIFPLGFKKSRAWMKNRLLKLAHWVIDIFEKPPEKTFPEEKEPEIPVIDGPPHEEEEDPLIEGIRSSVWTAADKHCHEAEILLEVRNYTEAKIKITVALELTKEAVSTSTRYLHFLQIKELIETKEKEYQAEKQISEAKQLDEGEKQQEALKAGTKKTLTIQGVNYTFCWCPPTDSFRMGSPKEEADRNRNETLHKVTLSRGFWLLETPVTQRMWINLMGSNPSRFKGGNRPVECVSWDDCQEFIEKINREGDSLPAGYKASLPSEAQWEYACRAGTKTPFNFGSTLNGDKANCDGNYPYGTEKKGEYIEETTEVKKYSPNDWNLYDMHGNVWEWCSDWYDEEYYEYSPEIDPTGPTSGSDRVIRGGGWGNGARGCRSAIRNRDDPTYRSRNLGFRLALVPSK